VKTKPRAIFVLPAGQKYPPVSVGELPSHKYQVSIETITEDVSSHLETHPEIPGVILVSDDKIHSMIPRAKMFERLGHRYGVELFLRKPIIELQETLGTTIFKISSNTRINTAANVAISRQAKNIYDPLVMEYDDGSFRQLDMHVLLMAQSMVMENMNNIITSMNRIEQSMKADIPLDTSLDMIIDAIKRTTPYHHSAILLKPSRWVETFSHHNLLHELSEPLNSHPLIKSIFNTENHIHIEDTNQVPSWKGMEVIGMTRAWLGLPIASRGNLDGILSLSRITNTPFSQNEIDMAKTFSELLSIAINRTAENYEEDHYVNMIKRKFIS
jgi:GAF domain-containing protein